MTVAESPPIVAPDGPTYAPLLEALYYLIGRRILDGANVADLPNQFAVDHAVVEEGWRVTQEQLSLDLALRDQTENRLRSFEELKAESPHCIRRLLEWREVLLAQVAVFPSPEAVSVNKPTES